MITVDGVGLFTGAAARVALSAVDGPSSFCGVLVRDLTRVAAERSTAVEARGRRVGTVEHLFGAMAGLGLHAGVAIDVEGGEIPLVDGAAARWCAALRSLGVVARAPVLRVVRDATISVGPCVYSFRPAEGVRVEVEAELGDARLAREVAWGGDAREFESRIAPARTFAFAAEVAAMAARGMASHVAPEHVVVVAKEGLLSAGNRAESDEPVRHKMLDLLGDMFLYGGPPRGVVRAFRPGHAATHEAMQRAVDEGIVEPREPKT